MDPTRSHSALDASLASLRVIWAAMLAGFGRFGVAPERQKDTYNWVSARFRKFEALLLRYRAGRLRRALAPRVAQKRQTGTRKAAVRMPRRFAWLVLTGRHHAAVHGSHLQHLVLNTPEVAALLEDCPQARRILRPLLRALAVELPWTVNKPPGPRKPRARKPRPEPDRAPLPRGVKTWIRKQKQMEKLIKLKHELVAKMGRSNPW